MSKISEIDLEIEKTKKAQKRLHAELEQLASREREVLEEVSKSQIAGAQVNVDELSGIRLKKETTQATLDLCDRKLKFGQEERASQVRAEIGGQWPALEKELRRRLGNVKGLLGAAGLQREISEIEKLLADAQQITSYVSQDAEIKTARLVHLVKDLGEAVPKFLDSINSIEKLP